MSAENPNMDTPDGAIVGMLVEMDGLQAVIDVRYPADGTSFGRDAFADQIGNEVPVVFGEDVVLARIDAVEVAEGGVAAILTLIVSDEADR